jgi:hypothetical protein
MRLVMTPVSEAVRYSPGEGGRKGGGREGGRDKQCQAVLIWEERAME